MVCSLCDRVCVQVCVSQCPKENYVYLESLALESVDRKAAREKLICKTGVDPVASTVSCSTLSAITSETYISSVYSPQ